MDNQILNYLAQNSELVAVLVSVLLSSIFTITVTLMNIRANRIGSTYDSILKRMDDTYQSIYKLFSELESTGTFVEDYKECQLLKQSNKIPSYYIVFDDVDKIDELANKITPFIQSESIFNTIVKVRLYFIKSYLQTVVIWLKKNPDKLKQEPNVKLFFSMDLNKLLMKLNKTITKHYQSRDFKRIKARGKKRAFIYMHIPLMRNYEMKNCFLHQLRHTIDGKGEKKFLIRYNACKECKSECIMKNSRK